MKVKKQTENGLYRAMIGRRPEGGVADEKRIFPYMLICVLCLTKEAVWGKI